MDSSRFVKVYDLREDKQHIKDVQDATLNTGEFGLKQEYGLFASEEWWSAIERGLIQKIVLESVISRVYMSGHNDFPEFEMSSNSEKMSWPRFGNDEVYVVGRKVRVAYVTQKFKTPIGSKVQRGYLSESRIVLEIWVEST